MGADFFCSVSWRASPGRWPKGSWPRRRPISRNQLWRRPSPVTKRGAFHPPGGSIPQTLGPVQLGPVDFHPHLLYRFIYGDGIPVSPTNHLTTAIQEISPGLLLNVGSHWTLDYTPTLRLYSNPKFTDGTDENALLNGTTHYEDWTFGLSQAYIYTTEPQGETEALTQQASYATILTASRQLGSHLTAQWSVNQTITSTSENLGPTTGISQDVHSWVLSSGLNYQTEYKLGFGINGSAGYDLISPGADIQFEQVQGTLNWQLAKKLSVVASAGMEVSQLMGAQLVDPTFSAAINYQPFEHTSASLVASRTVAPALFQDDVTVTTSISATFRQRFFQQFNFEVNGGYSSIPYVGFATVSELLHPNQIGSPVVLASVQQNRTDNYRFARVSVGSTFRQRGTVSIFYSYYDDASSLSAFNLSSKQVGIEIGWHY